MPTSSNLCMLYGVSYCVAFILTVIHFIIKLRIATFENVYRSNAKICNGNLRSDAAESAAVRFVFLWELKD